MLKISFCFYYSNISIFINVLIIMHKSANNQDILFLYYCFYISYRYHDLSVYV